MKNKRGLLFKALTVLVLIAIGAVMMVIGRGHTVYIDNKTYEVETESGTETYKAMNKVIVYVNGEKIAKLAARERGKSICIGQKFSMDLEITAEKGGETVTQTVNLKLPRNLDGIVINLPAYLNGFPEDQYMSEFVPAVVEEPEEDEEIVTDEFAMAEDF